MSASVYPTGTTIYDPERCWNGYTVFQDAMFEPGGTGAVLIDMNGNVVNQWKGLGGFPSKMLPGGHVMGSTGMRNAKYGIQDMLDLVQVDWDGNIVWRFDRHELIKDPHRQPTWMARQHHDYQRTGNPVGYFVPGMEPLTDSGHTLVLSHRNLQNPKINDRILLDDIIIEVDWEGNKVWEWGFSDHFEELGFSKEAKKTLARHPKVSKVHIGEVCDWMHVNSISTLGPNKWFDQGDARFHPDNIIWSSRETNIMGIIDKQTGKIVWQLGPDYAATPALRKLGWIIGQHHTHLIPRGLPGEGNVLVFDNGGTAGYGAPNPGSPTGVGNALRDYSRVLEIDPITLEVVWQCGAVEIIPGKGPKSSIRIYSNFISSAQRLPNGNTMITEGSSGRLIEVTPSQEIVWEYLNPYQNKTMKMSAVYRAYRLPYAWVPQADHPVEKAVPRLDISRFRVPGSKVKRPAKVTSIKK